MFRELTDLERTYPELVREGMTLEQNARKLAGGRADVVREAVEARVGQARERATDTWDRLEKVFEDRVQRALVKLGVPNRDDLNALVSRVDTLNAELRKLHGVPVARKASPKAPAKKAAAKKAAPRRTRSSAS